MDSLMPCGKLLHDLGLRQDQVDFPAAFDLRLAPVELLHGEFGRDVRAAAAVAEINRHVELEAQTVAFLHRPLESLVPLRAERRHPPLGRPPRSAHLHPQHAADAGALERLDIRRDPFFADVAVDPKPIHPRSG
jgi:hypothetical protein